MSFSISTALVSVDLDIANTAKVIIIIANTTQEGLIILLILFFIDFSITSGKI
jgi:hypothetical protein